LLAWVLKPRLTTKFGNSVSVLTNINKYYNLYMWRKAIFCLKI